MSPTDDERDAPRTGSQRYTANFIGACPMPDAVRALDRSGRRDATQVALAFNRALVEKDFTSAQRLALDPRISSWGHTNQANGVNATASEPAVDDGRVIMTCGEAVAERSWKVMVHDSNRVTGAGLATFYLVRVDEGWRVWGSYEPRI